MDLQSFGQLLILAALAMNIVAGVSFFAVGRGVRNVRNLAYRSYHLFVIFTAGAAALLYYLFFSDDFRFSYVYSYSESSQPFLYKLSAFWGGQEGTYVLWLLFSGLFGYLILKYAKKYVPYAMSVYALVNLFFLLVMTKLSPFAYLQFYSADGAGLNPLLRDPWMVIHPPIMFVGYAMAAIPFAIAMAAMLRNDYSDWLKLAFPWAAMTALMLGAGNILGGFWAYKTLGWGGYWGWDPVENSSFVPWMISLALLHGLIIEKRTGALRRTNLLMSAFLFLLVVYGTFLTRSGVLADFSVHSFTDLGINVYLIGFMVLFAGLTAVVFIYRTREISSSPLNYNIYGREFILFGGMVLLFVTGVIVLFWSSLPVLTSIAGMEPRAADIATYNSFALPLAILFSLLLLYSPFSTYSQTNPVPNRTHVLSAFGGSLIIGLVLFYFMLGNSLTMVALFTIAGGLVATFLFKPGSVTALAPALGALVVAVMLALWADVDKPLYVLFLGVAAMGFLSNLISVIRHLPDRWRSTGGQLTHVGFNIMLIGILASSAFGSQQKLILDRGQEKPAFGHEIGYYGMQDDIMQANNELLLSFENGGKSEELRPELYFSERMNGIFKKPAIVRSPLRDLYMAPEQIVDLEKEGDLLVLRKMVSENRGGVTFTFLGFDMGQHESGSQSMRVAARIEAQFDDITDTISPAIIQQVSPQGQSELVESPDSLTLAGGRSIALNLERIQADAGQVTISAPGLTSGGPVDRLVLDVSTKPLINFVWTGAILILAGCLIVFYRRMNELEHAEISQGRVSAMKSSPIETRTKS